MTARLPAHASTVVLLLASFGAHAAWTDWWRTPDQQAQQQLDAGHAEQAAGLFTDPRRRAYAELQAGKYAAAAATLASFEDAESQYNRGNALARAGDLQSALDAYDAALAASAPESDLRRDAQHNRDLVARQMQQQNPSSPQGEQDQQQDDQSQDQSGKSSNNSQGSEGKEEQQSPDKQGSQENGARSGGPQSLADSNPSTSQQPGQQQSNADQADTDQARRDAEASLREARQKEAAEKSRQAAAPHGAGVDEPSGSEPARMVQNDADDPDAQGRAATALATEPASEQALALDQWLRQIPDDPGGLLRRKFLIEHMMKQRESQR